MTCFLPLVCGLLNFKIMSSSAFLESERKKMKIEWEQLPNPKPNWEEYKRIKFKKTYK